MKQSAFEELAAINVNEHKEQKNGLNYLSWTWAWSELQKRYPGATYKIVKNEYNLPYFESPLGIMVYTQLTVEGITHEMWLPVMDATNRAMKTQRYSYQVFDRYKNAYVEKWVEAATMMDVNKAVMRCLTKNIAIFGLGLYIYANEDLPEAIEEPEPVPASDMKPVQPEKKPAAATKPTRTKNAPTPKAEAAKTEDPKKSELSPAEKAAAAKLYVTANEQAKTFYESYNKSKVEDFTEEVWVRIYGNLVYNGKITKETK